MNIVAIAGNLTKDPELRSTQTGKQVANFSVAINMGKDKTEFVNCIAWEKTGELIAQYCPKGSRFSGSGYLQTRSWEKDGEKKYATEVVIRDFDFPPKASVSGSIPDTGSGGNHVDEEIPF